MSATEIIAELPKLKEADRRAICKRILELAAEQEEIRIADEMFMMACQEADRIEDAKTKSTPR